MRNKIYLIVLFTLVSINVHSQQSSYFSFELAGSGGFGSLNYEHNVWSKSNVNLNMRYGFSFTPVDKANGINLVFPVMLHTLIGANKNKLELALGQAISITTKGSLFLTAPLAIGYRLQPLDKKYFFRFAYTPLVSYLLGIQWQHWGGITFGYHFNKKK